MHNVHADSFLQCKDIRTLALTLLWRACCKTYMSVRWQTLSPKSATSSND